MSRGRHQRGIYARSLTDGLLVLGLKADHGFDRRITYQQMRVDWGFPIGGFRARIGPPGE